MCLWCCWKDLDEQDLMESICQLNEFKCVENVVTLEGLPFNSSMISFRIWLFKKSMHILQNNVHMFRLFLYWVHTWANDTHHTSCILWEVENIP
jgi:hypothetical protein